MHLWKDFREFIARGNVVDLAIGVIIGGAFGRIVTSLVNDVIMPPIGLLLGRVNFSNLFINLSGQDYPSLDAAKAAGAPVIAYGTFINTVIDFLIVSFIIFFVIREVNQMIKKPPPKTKKDCPYCFSSIPIKAIKCPECTADLKETARPAASGR